MIAAAEAIISTIPPATGELKKLETGLITFLVNPIGFSVT